MPHCIEGYFYLNKGDIYFVLLTKGGKCFLKYKCRMKTAEALPKAALKGVKRTLQLRQTSQYSFEKFAITISEIVVAVWNRNNVALSAGCNQRKEWH